MKLRDCFNGRSVEIKLIDGGEGYSPYLWFGLDDDALGTIDRRGELTALIKMCERVRDWKVRASGAKS